MNLGPVAKVHVTPAGLEEIQGIRSATAEYALRHLRPNRQWRLELQNEAGQRGALTFIIPDRGTFFAVDPQDGIEDPAGGPVLYKEIRLSGPVSATGPFKGGTFSLVFQGRGNSCPDAAQFTSWILRVEGPGAAYALFGRLDPPTPRPGSQGRAGDLYFPSPEAAVRTLTELLRKEDWPTLARYYDLSDSSIAREDLTSGRFFLRTERPPVAHPGLPWKYRHPFTPGFNFEKTEGPAQAGVIIVVLAIEIDEGGGRIRRGMEDFSMRWSAAGYQVLPPYPGTER